MWNQHIKNVCVSECRFNKTISVVALRVNAEDANDVRKTPTINQWVISLSKLVFYVSLHSLRYIEESEIYLKLLLM